MYPVCIRYFVVALGISFASSAPAATVSFTGADLTSALSATFPFGSPTVSGNSIVFAPNSANWQKLLVLNLPVVSSLDVPLVITITANLTRLSDDWDPHLMIGDGTSLAGIALTDNAGVVGKSYGDAGGNFALGTNDDLGTRIPPNNFPAIGQATDVAVEVTLGQGLTAISALYDGQMANWTAALLPLDPYASLSLFLIGDDPLEQYQLNALTITSSAIVPIPAAAWLLGSALGMLGWMRRRTAS